MSNNPILRGFNPDPSICLVGDTYYIATSTFEWYPGVQIHKSTDLVNWTLVSRPLNRASLLDMRGTPDSCGVWAPCLTYSDGRFWLIYTHVSRFDGNFKDTPNYLTSCETIDGDWEDPVYLNSSGFDPSLFHDDDGRKYLLNMIWDHRPERTFFAGIYIQEYCHQRRQLIGQKRNIFKGSPHGLTEGPHLYKKDGYYYLLTAEGGTGYEHAMTMARSKALLGPYQLDPIGSFITAKDSPNLSIQRAGHGDLVETTSGDWFAVHLCSRPFSTKDRRSPMGRESAIQAVYWNNEGWLRLLNNTNQANEKIPDLGVREDLSEDTRYEFSGERLHEDFQWLRTPYSEHLFSLTANPGYLRLFGRQAIGSWHESTLVARRQKHFCYTAETCLRFAPNSFQQMAGLSCYYNSHKFHYAYLSVNDLGHACLSIMSCLGDKDQWATFEASELAIKLNQDNEIWLRATVNFEQLQFYYSTDGSCFHRLGDSLDYGILSDEAGKGEGANFTGAFVGVACQDVSGEVNVADVSYLSYQGEADE